MEKLHETATERRRLTRNSIYRYLYDAPGGRSKQEIAEDLAMSLPTVHQNRTELLRAVRVRPDGMSASTGGRRALDVYKRQPLYKWLLQNQAQGFSVG